MYLQLLFCTRVRGMYVSKYVRHNSQPSTNLHIFSHITIYVPATGTYPRYVPGSVLSSEYLPRYVQPSYHFTGKAAHMALPLPGPFLPVLAHGPETHLHLCSGPARHLPVSVRYLALQYLYISRRPSKEGL